MLVGVAQGGGHMGADIGGPVGRQGPGRLEDGRERPSVDEFHHDEVGARVLAPVEHRHDVGMGEVGGRLRLPAEPLHERTVDGQLGEQDLERHRPVEESVVGAVDLGHAAPGDQVIQLVALGEDARRLVRFHVGQSLNLRSLGSGVLIVPRSLWSVRIGRDLMASDPGRRPGWPWWGARTRWRRCRCRAGWGPLRPRPPWVVGRGEGDHPVIGEGGIGTGLAVPVLAATFQLAGNPTVAAVPWVTTFCIRPVTADAVTGLVAVNHGLGCRT